ncbi:uncharacterized mitochondrial protein AtMg00860-like [Helianthus annuus]|uniref:uncharacterized mitochondrial protein AtMg00860-like n=1 Tax=Helianthus annuus TaxID=4232 RepID=UPI000B8FF05D|nr:uncharacterized mitochondrial protein AtMg00860-like [Helianthus annuus]
MAEISLNAIFGKSNTTTMKLSGTLNSTEILILIDSGSTHNFISDNLVRELGLTTHLVTPFGVQIGNGDIIRCNKVPFLGHIVTAAGVQVDQEKISAVVAWPLPVNVKAIRGFLGLTGYYRRFVRNYGIIARPLTAFTKKEGFKWSQEAAAAFEKLKQALISAPVLRLPDFHAPFMVECDASSDGVGAILIQHEHPVIRMLIC